MSVDTEIAELKARVTAAEKKRMLAELNNERTSAAAATALQMLTDEYGITDVASAKTYLAGLEEQIQTEISKVEVELAIFEEQS